VAVNDPGLTTATAVTLPADGTSPALARRHVRASLQGAGLNGLVDDVLLLVTELVTNAVVHAGTPVELELSVDADGLLVQVGDWSPGSTPVVRAQTDADSREGGRGIFMLDALAEEWGTRHTHDRKTVWFRVGLPDRPGRAARPAPALDVPVGPQVALTLGWLLALPEDVEHRLSSDQALTELLHRLADALKVDEAVLLVEDERQPDTWTAAAVRGARPRDDEVADLRRKALGAETAVVVGAGRTIVPLRGRGGPFGALVLHQAPLDSVGTTVARLAAERLGLVLRDDRAEVAQRRQRGSLALLAEASDLFAATLDVQLAVTLATQLVVPRLAQWAAVYLVSDRGAQLSSVTHEDEERTGALRVGLSSSAGTTFAERLARDLAVQRPSLVGRAELGTVLGHSALGDAGQGDVLAVPLVARRRLLGGLLVARPSGSTYSAEDVALLLDLGRRAALAVDNARLYEERTGIAQALQASLLPAELPQAREVQFGARYHPAGEGNEVGGDFYDVFTLPDGGWGIAIGDVCGKGAEAAAITGLARNVVRLLAREGRAPSEVLRRLNDAVLELGDRGRFCTAALAVVRPGPGGVLDITYSSGGHPPPVLVPASGRPGFVGTSGTVIGVLDRPDLADERLRLSAGDVLVLYTDGVTERRNGRQMFGDDTLLRVLAGASAYSADAVAGRLEGEVRHFGAEAARDDLAVLVVRATGVAGAGPARPAVARQRV
jgi:phosphoserine phosphatase RsbU/P